jgi:cation diffusion facilitator family transporter
MTDQFTRRSRHEEHAVEPAEADADHDGEGGHGDDHHGHGHAQAGKHATGLVRRARNLLAPHTHDAGDVVDSELEASQRGVRTLVISFAGLGITALLQAAVVLLSGSVALLGDTLHNFADALTAIPLAIAFTLGRRIATRRFTYGYGRAEDLAGLFVVLLMTASAAVAVFVAVHRLLHPQDVRYLWLIAVASLIGFAGNELVAHYRIRVGREIGSAALVADGLHARTDGLTSLAVLIGVGGVALGFPLADPIVGLLVTVAILAATRQAAREVFGRLLDAVDPALVALVDRVVRTTPGVVDVGEVRLRWIGHALRAECEVTVAPTLSIVDAHRVAEETQHRLLHQVRRLTSALVHADPEPAVGEDHHTLSAHHRAALLT